MADEQNKGGAREAARKAVKTAQAAQSVKNAGKAAAKIAAGDIAGGAKDVLKDGNLRQILLIVIAIAVAIPMMLFSMVPNALMLPSEDAYSNNDDSVSLIDIIKGWFHFGDEGEDIGFSLDFLTTTAYAEEEIDSWLSKRMIDENSLKVVADDGSEGFKDFDEAPNNADKTMDKMMKVTKDRYEKRRKNLLNTIKDDFREKKNYYYHTDDYDKSDDFEVIKTITDPLATGATSTDKEAMKLLCLYSVQMDDDILNMDFNSYLDWLGNPDSVLFFFEVDDDEYEGTTWDILPQKWKGTMLPQKQTDEARKMKDEGKSDEEIREAFYEYYTSAISELLRLSQNVEEEINFTTDDDGNEIATSVNISYTLELRSVDEICNDVVKFSEAVEKNPDGTDKNVSASAHREEYYKEMVGDGEGNGVTLDYFGISSGSGLVSGSGLRGSGSSIVQVALAEVGYMEKATNSQLDDPTANAGNGNYTKYGAWFPMNGVAWCNIFVSWCAEQCGVLGDIIPKSASCSYTWTWFNKESLTHRYGDGYIPQPGDLVLRGPGDHIGIVESCDPAADELWTIEGNTSGNINDNDGSGVHNKKYTWSSNSGRWYGFCTPQYPSSSGGPCLIAWAYETGGQTYGQYNVWFCGTLAAEGFPNYGAMSTNKGAAKNMYNYIITNSENFKNQIGTMILGTTAFDSWWTGPHSDEDTAEMTELQAAWTWEAYGAPAASGKYSFLTRSEALQAMVISRSVHRGSGGAVKMFERAGINESMSDDEIITAIYRYEANNITAASPVYTPALRNRMRNEFQMFKEVYNIQGNI